jgi:tellurite resistance-related uncharacterized protein
VTDVPAAVEMPPGLEVVRTTVVFDRVTAPHGLLRAHSLAPEVWARLVVETGTVEFVFEDRPNDPHTLVAGEHQVVPPVRPHHITPDEGATFFLEFHRAPHDPADEDQPS